MLWLLIVVTRVEQVNVIKIYKMLIQIEIAQVITIYYFIFRNKMASIFHSDLHSPFCFFDRI